MHIDTTIAMFQPFLRFYLVITVNDPDTRPYEVSTLLEILPLICVYLFCAVGM